LAEREIQGSKSYVQGHYHRAESAATFQAEEKLALVTHHHSKPELARKALPVSHRKEPAHLDAFEAGNRYWSAALPAESSPAWFVRDLAAARRRQELALELSAAWENWAQASLPQGG
jgi:hypothetical protein